MRPLSSALRTFNTQLPGTKSGSAIQTGSQSGIDRETYSHSIINEASELLICIGLDSASQSHTVIFTVKLRGTSIGAGLQAVCPNPTFRDLSAPERRASPLLHVAVGLGEHPSDSGIKPSK